MSTDEPGRVHNPDITIQIKHPVELRDIVQHKHVYDALPQEVVLKSSSGDSTNICLWTSVQVVFPLGDNMCIVVYRRVAAHRGEGGLEIFGRNRCTV